MNFFEQQEKSRRKTVFLISYFVIAVLTTAILVYLAVSALVLGTYLNGLVWEPNLFYACSGLTCLLILLGSFFKHQSLKRGGRVVAESIGCRLVNPQSKDIAERRAYNVVEEMAIASGMPVPPLYLMEDEDGINAFAAGYSTDDAVVALSQGAVYLLSRDELQGVVAHEFSHILNGDMRLNIRLIAILNGLLMVALSGRMILRPRGFSGRRYRGWASMSRRAGRRNRRSGGRGAGVLLLGVFLVVLGSAGVFFGKLIKAAVSREREYLADASAVQFTRNPEGISGALKKIGGLTWRSYLSRPNAEELSHLFFARGVKPAFLSGWLSTHPPLSDRIKAIDKSFDGKFEPLVAPKMAKEVHDYIPREEASAFGLGRESVGENTKFLQAVKRRAEEAKQEIGLSEASFAFPHICGEQNRVAKKLPDISGYIDEGSIFNARLLLSEIPPELLARAKEPHGAFALLVALLVDRFNTQTRSQQVSFLAKFLDSRVFSEFRLLNEEVQLLRSELRLPLVDLSLPALKRLSEEQFQHFKDIVDRLIKIDKKCSIFEYAVQAIVLRHLSPTFNPELRFVGLGRLSLKKMGDRAHEFIELICCENQDSLKVGYLALKELGVPVSSEVKHPSFVGGYLALEDMRRFDELLELLVLLSPEAREDLVQVVSLCLTADREFDTDDAELLRVVCELLYCPLPRCLKSSSLLQ